MGFYRNQKGDLIATGSNQIWVHTPTGREFTNQLHYEVAAKAWEKRYPGLSVKDIARLRARDEFARLVKEQERKKEEERVKRMLERDVKRKVLNDRIENLCNLHAAHMCKRKNAVQRATLELSKQIAEYENVIRRTKQALFICKRSMALTMKECRTEFDKKTPSPYTKEIKRLRKEYYKL